MQKILIDTKKSVKIKVSRDGMIEISSPFKLEHGKKKPKKVRILSFKRSEEAKGD